MIELSFDEATGIVRTVGIGRWTAAEVDAHFEALAELLARLRGEGRSIRILSDVTRAEVQTPAIEARISAHAARVRRPEDRVALVVKTNLLKVHVRKAGAPSTTELFCSHAAAEMWPCAHDWKVSA
jgi:hypothetical protein